MTASATAAEFDDVTGWTADAVEQLGIRHAVPAACRGSASPVTLAWLAEACELSPGVRRFCRLRRATTLPPNGS
ncbi:hypothetical protein [Streptosporangium minutum]|uniref:hypothetical protein n=1 Tax=Streptosporangium minutum TaxID=569862 RepID=UPI001054513A|nr:hypothetical protein [Streptosporangium minutum]